MVHMIRFKRPLYATIEPELIKQNFEFSSK